MKPFKRFKELAICRFAYINKRLTLEKKNRPRASQHDGARQQTHSTKCIFKHASCRSLHNRSKVMF